MVSSTPNTAGPGASEYGAVILCAGDSARWFARAPAGTGPKQLAEVDGERLIDRTARLCRQLGVTEIAVAALDARITTDGARLLRPDTFSVIPETLISTSAAWAERTIVLLGDVFYTEAALRTIVSWRGDLAFFGRAGPNPFTLWPYGEIFGLHFGRRAWHRVRRAAFEAVEATRHGGRGKLWDVLRAVPAADERGGGKSDGRSGFGGLFVPIRDFTDDIDTWEQYALLRESRAFCRDWQVTEERDLVAPAARLAAYFARGEKLFAQGAYNEAVVVFETILKYHPRHTGSRRVMGLDDVSPVGGDEGDFWAAVERDARRGGSARTEASPPALEDYSLAAQDLWLRSLRARAVRGDRQAARHGAVLYRLLSDRAVEPEEISMLTDFMRANRVEFPLAAGERVVPA